jgi:hypothetical protein
MAPTAPGCMKNKKHILFSFTAVLKAKLSTESAGNGVCALLQKIDNNKTRIKIVFLSIEISL